jgi:hypothetical protein
MSAVVNSQQQKNRLLIFAASCLQHRSIELVIFI